MFNVSQYLQKFVRLGADLSLARDAVSRALKEECGIEGVDFEIKKGVVYMKGQPAIKAAVFMRKGRILERLRSDAPKARISDIR